MNPLINLYHKYPQYSLELLAHSVPLAPQYPLYAKYPKSQIPPTLRQVKLPLDILIQPPGWLVVLEPGRWYTCKARPQPYEAVRDRDRKRASTLGHYDSLPITLHPLNMVWIVPRMLGVVPCRLGVVPSMCEIILSRLEVAPIMVTELGSVHGSHLGP